MGLKENKQRLFEEVANVCKGAGRKPEEVTIVAVTKYVDSQTAEELVQAGVQHLGENRVDKFLEKYQALADYDLTWHLIGSLQRRKVKDVINYVDYFHALDSLKLASEIQKRALHPIKCFLQVNISGEESKHGFRPDQVEEVVQSLKDFDKLMIVGLMTMAPLGASDSQLAEIFKQTDNLRKFLKGKKIKNMPMEDLSMGMSGDFPIAIQNGSTFVRIGSSFFN
ncbi:YggS family pyridoxal phosphate-dependent enzyme [Streptococcus ferus]|uniref:Pyridoxal phosphate homeostasis protein n=1 Tax=Streptococcus ferus TaxID=1345 RepID=A0A2X3W7B5_9STRE|nr:YggS family pyridoxal phosphate-dependent enzyme [Streptococcus ferus]SQF39673.1 pyridoxal phosphate enzyme, YggS family [Streptococcus ferus]